MASSTENRKELIMKNTNYLKIAAAATAAFMISAATGFTAMAGAFGTGSAVEGTPEVIEYTSENNTPEVAEYTSDSAASATVYEDQAEDAAATSSLNMVSGGALDTTDMFTARDLEQTADLSEAQSYTITDGQTIEITSEGVYVITGTASNAYIVVEAGDEDKVQIVLDGVSITNDSAPCIYVKSADKVFVTTTDSENSLTVTGTFSADGDTNTDAVIFSKDDLVLNGTGTLTIKSTDNGVTSKDDLKITGGTLNITCTSDALEANDSIRIADGIISIDTAKDALHAENDEDDTVGFVYICGGTLNVESEDDAIHATTIIQIDDGELNLKAHEGLEATWIQVNGGEINIEASDDAINAAYKSAKITPAFEITGGYVTIVMGSGDTDAVDSNANLILTGGTLDITAQSPFDYDGTYQKTGCTLIINGTETDSVSNQMMGGGCMGGMGGMHGGRW